MKEILYKYRSLEPGERAHTLRTISHSEVWFGSLADFNDPFEARVSVSMIGNDEEWRREFGCPRPARERLPYYESELAEGVRTDSETFGIFCLSETRDDIVMWSHYAGSHRGVCFGFRTNAKCMCADAQPIEYSDEYPQVDYFKMTREERGRKMLLVKASHSLREGVASVMGWRGARGGHLPARRTGCSCSRVRDTPRRS